MSIEITLAFLAGSFVGAVVARKLLLHYSSPKAILEVFSEGDLTKIQEAAKARSNVLFPRCSTWSLASWALLLTSEAGEAGNEVSHALRDTDKLTSYARSRIAIETADTIISALLLFNAIDENALYWVCRTFDAKSDKHGWQGIRLLGHQYCKTKEEGDN